MLGNAGEGAGCFAQILGGRITAFDGRLTIAGAPLADLPTDDLRGRELAYAGPEPVVLEGTLRDDILYGLRLPGRNGEWIIDRSRAGAASPRELGSRLADVLNTVGLSRERIPLRPGAPARPGRADRPHYASGGATRRHQGEACGIRRRGRGRALRPGSPYTKNATIGENLLFGVPMDDALAGASLASHAFDAPGARPVPS